MANVPTVSWAETSPANDDNASQGDDRIRELKTQIREVVGVDHDFPSSGQATDNGQHLRVTLQEQADLGTGAEGTTILGNQTVSGKGELVYTDEDDNDLQFSNGGTLLAINTQTAKTTPIAADSVLLNDSEASNISKKATLASIIGNIVYPVGSYYFNDSVSTNPGTLLGFGTWVALEGRVLVGKAASGTFDTAQEELGAETVTLTGAQSGVAAHTHDLAGSTTGGGTTAVEVSNNTAATSTTTGAVTGGAANAAEAHSNLQPSRTVYIWRRTA